MCRCSDESMNYLLLDCDTANGMGIYVFSVFWKEVLVIFYLVGGISLAKTILLCGIQPLHSFFFLYVSNKFYCKETALKKLQKTR